MKTREHPSQQELQRLYNYNPDTGVFTHKVPGRGKRVGKEAGTLANNRYFMYVKGELFLRSRLAWIYVNGEIPDQMLIDHINRDSKDDRVSNLRLATYTQNNQNRKHKGYYYDSAQNKFRAQIKINGVNTHLGGFDTEEEAREAYVASAKLHHGEFAVQ